MLPSLDVVVIAGVNVYIDCNDANKTQHLISSLKRYALEQLIC